MTREEVPLFEYQLPGGWVVLAGRTDRAKEVLSLKLAAAGDIWVMDASGL